MPSWWITVMNLPLNVDLEGSKEEVEKYLLATWKTNLGGINWLTTLAEEGKATWEKSEGNHSWRFITKASNVLPVIVAGHLTHEAGWVFKDNPAEEPSTQVDWSEKSELWLENIARCRPEDVLTVDAWGHS